MLACAKRERNGRVFAGQHCAVQAFLHRINPPVLRRGKLWHRTDERRCGRLFQNRIGQAIRKLPAAVRRH